MILLSLPTARRKFVYLLAALAIIGGPHEKASYAADECPLGQFFAQYYETSQGANRRVFTSCEPAEISHDWGTTGAHNRGAGNDSKSDSMASLAVGPNNFRVTWTGRFRFQDGLYTFVAIADDGIRVKVDGELLIDEWRVQPATEFRRKKGLTGGIHSVDVEYFQGNEAAVAKLQWQRAQ